jgi:hypothetical protein
MPHRERSPFLASIDAGHGKRLGGIAIRFLSLEKVFPPVAIGFSSIELERTSMAIQTSSVGVTALRFRSTDV